MNHLNPISKMFSEHFANRPCSIRIKGWAQKQGDMSVKVELWQDGQESFEVSCQRLGQSIPTLYRFASFESADAHYCAFIDHNKDEPEIAAKLQAELQMLHSLCASAQCWLDAAGHFATNYETKCALQRNADEFRQCYAQITS